MSLAGTFGRSRRLESSRSRPRGLEAGWRQFFGRWPGPGASQPPERPAAVNEDTGVAGRLKDQLPEGVFLSGRPDLSWQGLRGWATDRPRRSLCRLLRPGLPQPSRSPHPKRSQLQRLSRTFLSPETQSVSSACHRGVIGRYRQRHNPGRSELLQIPYPEYAPG